MGVVGADVSSARRNLTGLDRDLRNTRDGFQQADKAGRGMFKSLGSAASGSGGVLDLLGGISSAVQMLPGLGMVAGSLGKITGAMGAGINKGFDYRRAIEENSIAFEVMLKSGDKAKSLIEDLSKKAEQSPFAFTEIVTTTKQLLAMGYSVDEVKQRLIPLSDASSALGADMGRMVTALGQMRAKGKVSFEEMGQLAEAGVPAWRYLADELARTDKNFAKLTSDQQIGRVMKLAEAGKLNARGAEQAIMRGVKKQFGGIGKRVAEETATGLESNLGDVASRLAGTASGPLFEKYKNVLRTTLAAMNSETAAGLANSAVKVQTAVFGGFDAALDTFQEAASLSGMAQLVGKNFVGAGGAAVSGFVGKLQEGSKLATDAGAKLGLSAVMGLAGPDGIDAHSPSRKTFEQGLNFWHGFEDGLMSGAASGVPRINALFDDLAQSRGGRGLGAPGMNRSQAQAYAGLQRRMSLEPAFMEKLKKGSYARGINPDHLLNLIALETGGSFRPDIKNPTSTATGLIQFMRATMDGSRGKDGRFRPGLMTGTGKRHADLAKMSATEQLDWVFKYFDQPNLRGKLGTQGALYAAVGGGRASRDDNSVLFTKKDGDAYRLNAPAWDRNKDGIIRQGELGEAAHKRLGAGQFFTVNGGTLSNSNPMPVTIVGNGWGPTDRSNRPTHQAPAPAPGRPSQAARPAAVAELRELDQVVASVASGIIEVRENVLGTALMATKLEPLPDIFTLTKEAVAETNDEIEQTVALLESTGGRIDQVMSEIGNSFEGLFGQFLPDIASDGMAEAGRRMLLGFIQAINQMAAEALAANLAAKLFGAVGENGSRSGGWIAKAIGWGVGALFGGLGSGGGPSASKMFGGNTGGFSFGGRGAPSFGGSFLGGSTPRFSFATGGFVPAGREVIVGERGREAFLPSTSGRIVPLEKMGGPRVSIQLNVHGVRDARSFREAEAHIGRRAGLAAQAALQKYA